MEMENNCDIELRSEKVRSILGDIPQSLLMWGTGIIIFIFLTLLIVVCFVPYPHSEGESIMRHILFM